ncbi:MAG TPA: GMC family oxidoreductase [Nitrososphaeraceae archaeon]|nr:GMC family oxidoreductase [Nitrososphaeraceae archaeon]
MTFTLKGKLFDPTDPNNIKPYSYHTIKVFDKDPFFDIFGDDPLGSVVTLDDGTFRIDFRKEDFRKPLETWETDPNAPELYFKVYDPDGNLIKETPVIATPYAPYNNPNEVNQCEAVVVGSGFGGTIVSLSLVNQFEQQDQALPDTQKRKVVILERGQWWVSHELPLSPSSHEFEKKVNPDKGIREYLDSNDKPYRTWAYPDNVSGLGQFLNTLRVADRRGLLDYRISSKVHTIGASGVGGGSLVYTNVTEKPEKSVLDLWDTQLNLGINDTNLSKYFEMAKGFIGVNKIPTNTANGAVKLPKTKAFHDAAAKIKLETPTIVTNPTTFDPTDPLVEDIYAVDLSITDIPYRKDEKTLFKKGSDPYTTVLNSIQTNTQMQQDLAVFLKKYFAETNVCERQGRCALGCIPGARHTNNKKIFDYLRNQSKKKHFDVYPLSEVYDIEPLTTGTHNYKVYYTDYGARDWKQASFNWNVGSKSYKLDVRLFRLVDNGKKKTIECKTLVLAAGAIGSTEILLKATNTTRTSGQKLNLSDKLGAGYSTNGDLLGVINPTKTDIYATRGPIVTSAIRFDEGPGSIYTIEDSSIPKMFSGISRLISQGPSFRSLLGFAGLGTVQTIINMITQNPPSIPAPNSNATLPVQISEQDLNNVLLLSGMGTDTSEGTIKLLDSWKNNPNRDMNTQNVLNVDFDLNKLAPLFAKMRNSMERIAKHIGENGSSSFSTPLWDPSDISGSATIVLHNLGGCCMGKDRNNGVVDNLGRVYKGTGATLTDRYPNFYVADGGVIPTSLGVNSSLTISALAFMIAENIVISPNFLPVEPVTLTTGTTYFPK